MAGLVLLGGSSASNELCWLFLLGALVGPFLPLSIAAWLTIMGFAATVQWCRLVFERFQLRKQLYASFAELPEFRMSTCTASDGESLTFYVSMPRNDLSDATLSPRRAVLLFGGDGLAAFRPFIATLSDAYAIVLWDMRGYEPIADAHRLRRVSVTRHAEDAAAVLSAAGFGFASVAMGYSLGVQAALEFALLYPMRVTRLVLLNGTHGRVLESVLQPVVRMPLAGTVVSAVAMLLETRPSLVARVVRLATPIASRVLRPLFCLVFSSSKLATEIKPTYLAEFYASMFSCLDPARGESSLSHVFSLLLEFNSHTVLHHLHQMQQPMVILSGALDMLTPALCASEMAQQLPYAWHFCDAFSTHATLLESPQWALHHIHGFMLATDSEDAKTAAAKRRIAGRKSE
jgi:pimeloyl-ACP methyl ester carboxylesterase